MTNTITLDTQVDTRLGEVSGGAYSLLRENNSFVLLLATARRAYEVSQSTESTLKTLSRNLKTIVRYIVTGKGSQPDQLSRDEVRSLQEIGG